MATALLELHRVLSSRDQAPPSPDWRAGRLQYLGRCLTTLKSEVQSLLQQLRGLASSLVYQNDVQNQVLRRLNVLEGRVDNMQSEIQTLHSDVGRILETLVGDD